MPSRDAHSRNLDGLELSHHRDCATGTDQRVDPRNEAGHMVHRDHDDSLVVWPQAHDADKVGRRMDDTQAQSA